MFKKILAILALLLFAQSANADLYCYASRSRLRVTQKGTKYSIALLNEDLLRMKDPVYMMETMDVTQAEADVLASTAASANVQIDGFENCQSMSTCQFNEIRPGNDLVKCTEGQFEFTAKIVGSKVKLICSQKADGGVGQRSLSVTLTERGCRPEPVSNGNSAGDLSDS